MRLGRFPNIPAAGYEDDIPDNVSDAVKREGAREVSKCRVELSSLQYVASAWLHFSLAHTDSDGHINRLGACRSTLPSFRTTFISHMHLHALKPMQP